MLRKFYTIAPTLGADYMLREQGFDVVDDPAVADAIVFCGGADISPELYGEVNVASSPSYGRDKNELDFFFQYAGKKPLIGICRGAQLLNVMAGGLLYQDVDKHQGYHPIYDLEGRKVGTVNSVHHQMMRPTPEAEIHAVAFESTYRIREVDGLVWREERLRQADPEVVWYPKYGYYCIQAHPEFGHPPTTKRFLEDIERLF